LFLDGVVLEASGTLVGAVAKPAELVVATKTELFVFDAQGASLDRLGEESLPGLPVVRLGMGSDGRVVLEVEGGRIFASADLLEFVEVGAEAASVWSRVRESGGSRATLRKALAEGAEFTWSRVVTDLHSGSLFGKIGKFLVDFTGVAVIGLTLFGIRLLFKRN
jgi:hypothetical protein